MVVVYRGRWVIPPARTAYYAIFLQAVENDLVQELWPPIYHRDPKISEQLKCNAIRVEAVLLTLRTSLCLLIYVFNAWVSSCNCRREYWCNSSCFGVGYLLN